MSGAAGPVNTAPSRTGGWALVGLTLLLLLSLLYVFGAASDLAAGASGGLPADHQGTFTHLAGVSFDHVKATAPDVAGYVSVLERGYAHHELTFGVLFIVLLVFPFRRRQRWAWSAAWIPMVANLGYTFTFGIHDRVILTRSLIADIGLPVLLLAHVPAFFSRRSRS